MKKQFLTVATLVITAALPAGAASYVYEGFDYALSDGTAMGGVATTATGLTGNYTSTTTSGGTGSAVYSTTGLSFGSNFYSVTGGALTMSMTSGSTSTRSIQLNAGLNAGTQTDTLYTSNLFQLLSVGSSGTTAQNGASTSQMRLTSAANASTNAHFSELLEGGTTSGASAVTYDGGSGSTRTNGTVVLSLNTTYLSISKFTNIGTTGQTTSAELWVLDLAGYNNWLTLGGGLEANLSTYAVTYLSNTSATTTSTNSAFNNSQFLSFAASDGSTSLTQSFTVDEARYGSSLVDVVNVTAVPEASTLSLLLVGLGLAGVILMIRRRAVSAQ